MITTTLTIPADHPSYPGHFPGTPVLPGAVLLDATLRAVGAYPAAEALAEQARGGPAGWQIASAKFQTAVHPGEPLTLEHEELPSGAIRFAIRSCQRPVASGILLPAQSGLGIASGDQS